jgi:outer membrane lipoprotein-sorting protein
VVQRAPQDYDASLAGRESVEGRPAYVLDLKPEAGGAETAPTTLWVDAQLWPPVKVTSAMDGNPFT